MPDLSGYRFTPTHEWVRRDGETATVGISDHAQAQLGDVIFLDLPPSEPGSPRARVSGPLNRSRRQATSTRRSREP